MILWVVIAIIAGVIVVTAVAAQWLRRSSPPPAPIPAAPRAEDQGERQARQQVVSARSTELLERRVELDARRGALGGDFGLSQDLDRLQERRRAGEISEDDYEAEKIRLLGG